MKAAHIYLARYLREMIIGRCIGPAAAARIDTASICCAFFALYWAGSVCAPHSETARMGSIVPPVGVVICPVAIAFRTPASVTPLCAA